MAKLPLRIILLLNTHAGGLTYKELSQKTDYHSHTISRKITYLDNKGLIVIEQKKSKNLQGRKWVNVVKLKKEFKDDNVAKFLSRISKQLDCSLNDIFIN